MKFNKRKLMAQLALNGVTTIQLANKLGISASTLHRKMNGDSDFYRNEIFVICEYLNIKSPVDIFFASELTETQLDQ